MVSGHGSSNMLTDYVPFSGDQIKTKQKHAKGVVVLVEHGSPMHYMAFWGGSYMALQTAEVRVG